MKATMANSGQGTSEAKPPSEQQGRHETNPPSVQTPDLNKDNGINPRQRNKMLGDQVAQMLKVNTRLSDKLSKSKFNPLPTENLPYYIGFITKLRNKMLGDKVAQILQQNTKLACDITLPQAETNSTNQTRRVRSTNTADTIRTLEAVTNILRHEIALSPQAIQNLQILETAIYLLKNKESKANKQ
jgi:hypothetical protein